MGKGSQGRGFKSISEYRTTKKKKKCTFDRKNTKIEKETDKEEEEFMVRRENDIKSALPLSVCSFLVYRFVCVKTDMAS